MTADLSLSANFACDTSVASSHGSAAADVADGTAAGTESSPCSAAETILHTQRLDAIMCPTNFFLSADTAACNIANTAACQRDGTASCQPADTAACQPADTAACQPADTSRLQSVDWSTQAGGNQHSYSAPAPSVVMAEMKVRTPILSVIDFKCTNVGP